MICPKKFSALDKVKDRWLCFWVLCLKSQIPSTPPKERRAGKLQIKEYYMIPVCPD